MKGICPICQQANICAVDAGKDPLTCWCMLTKIPKGLLEQIPKEQRGQSCVCQSCITHYNELNP